MYDHLYEMATADFINKPIFISYTMGTSGFPDVYTWSLRAAGPRAEGVYIRWIMSAYGITTM